MRLIEHFHKIDIFFGKIACTVRMFRHGEMLLLPHARRMSQQNMAWELIDSVPLCVPHLTLCLFL